MTDLNSPEVEKVILLISYLLMGFCMGIAAMLWIIINYAHCAR